MLTEPTTDHRRSPEPDLLAALADRDPLGLAEAYHRSAEAAHGVARRLLGAAGPAEAALRRVYAELWADPPADVTVEAWVRARTWKVCASALLASGRPAASPSAAELLPELGAPQARAADAAERTIAALPPPERRVLLDAHDRGRPAGSQGDATLVRALVALAGNGAGAAAGGCSVPGIGDWVLGLVPPHRAAEIAEAVVLDRACADLARLARRGRRRIEGLPPAPDMGQRVLATVLAGAGAGAVPRAPAPAPASAEPEPEPEPVAREPEPVAREPEPVAREPEPEPVAREPEPEPVAREPEPEPVAREPEAVAAEPEAERAPDAAEETDAGGRRGRSRWWSRLFELLLFLAAIGAAFAIVTVVLANR